MPVIESEGKVRASGGRGCLRACQSVILIRTNPKGYNSGDLRCRFPRLLSDDPGRTYTLRHYSSKNVRQDEKEKVFAGVVVTVWLV
eukprot:768122-Hanusia_phi.AAC.3